MIYSCLIYTFLSLAVYPSLIVLLIFALFLMTVVSRFAMKTSVDCLRYNAISRSPINSYYASSL